MKTEVYLTQQGVAKYLNSALYKSLIEQKNCLLRARIPEVTLRSNLLVFGHLTPEILEEMQSIYSDKKRPGGSIFMADETDKFLHDNFRKIAQATGRDIIWAVSDGPKYQVENNDNGTIRCKFEDTDERNAEFLKTTADNEEPEGLGLEYSFDTNAPDQSLKQRGTQTDKRGDIQPSFGGLSGYRMTKAVNVALNQQHSTAAAAAKRMKPIKEINDLQKAIKDTKIATEKAESTADFYDLMGMNQESVKWDQKYQETLSMHEKLKRELDKAEKAYERERNQQEEIKEQEEKSPNIRNCQSAQKRF